jgi:hypothetical protein
MDVLTTERPTAALLDLATQMCAASERLCGDSEAVRLDTQRLIAQTRALVQRLHTARDARQVLEL